MRIDVRSSPTCPWASRVTQSPCHSAMRSSQISNAAAIRRSAARVTAWRCPRSTSDTEGPTDTCAIGDVLLPKPASDPHRAKDGANPLVDHDPSIAVGAYARLITAFERPYAGRGSLPLTWLKAEFAPGERFPGCPTNDPVVARRRSPNRHLGPRLAPYGTLSRLAHRHASGLGVRSPRPVGHAWARHARANGQLGGRVEITRWDELQLVQRCKQGSEAAFAELVRRHRPRLFTLSFRLTGDRDAAEDVVQETFVAAFRTIDRFEPRPSLAAWLNTIAVHNAGKVAAKARARPRSSLDTLVRRRGGRPARRDCEQRRRSPPGRGSRRAAPRTCRRNRGSAVQIPRCGRDEVRARAGVRRGGGEPRDGAEHLQEPPPSRHPDAARGPVGRPRPTAGQRRRSARRSARQPGNGSRLRAGCRVATSCPRGGSCRSVRFRHVRRHRPRVRLDCIPRSKARPIRRRHARREGRLVSPGRHIATTR